MSYQDDSPIGTQMEAIMGMLSTAAEHGLEVEVVREAMHSYREMENADIAQACTNAMVEWDL